MKKQRVEWIDVLKLLGITAVFCGHLGRETGGLYDFVFLYHVPLFFFASGIFAGNSEALGLWQAVRKRFRQIMLPYLFFVMISMVVILLTTEENIYVYMGYGKQFIFGIRNQLYASSLWFFPCIFCMSVLFDMLRRIFRKDILLLPVSAAIYCMTIFLLPNKPDVTPSWIFNIDSALYYLIYYTAGFLLRGKLQEEWQDCSVRGKAVRLACAVLLTGYAVLVYTRKDVLAQAVYRTLPGADVVYPVIRGLLLILFHVVLAKVLTGIGNLHAVGAQTMWLCGNEFIVKKIFTAAAGIVGVQAEIRSALAAVLYACILIGFIYKVLLPMEKKVYHRLLEYTGLKPGETAGIHGETV